MKKLKMTATQSMTFEEGCNKYLEYCRQRNLREGTVGHYRQSYTQFYKYFDPKMSIEDKAGLIQPFADSNLWHPIKVTLQMM